MMAFYNYDFPSSVETQMKTLYQMMQAFQSGVFCAAEYALVCDIVILLGSQEASRSWHATCMTGVSDLGSTGTWAHSPVGATLEPH